MNKDRQLLLKSILVSYIIASLIFVILVSFAPDSTPYSANNYGWNGLQHVVSKYNIHEISSLSDITTPANDSVLLEIAPSAPYSNSSSQTVKSFVGSGGTLIVADSSGYSNSLLRGIGAQISVSGNTIYDPVYNWKQKVVPLALVFPNSQYAFLSGVNTLAMSDASSMVLSGGNPTVFATSSPDSTAVNDSTNVIVSKGPFAMGAFENLGSGRLVVISDSTFFIDSVWNNGNNQVLLNNLLQNSTVYLDTSAWPINSQTTIRANLVTIYSILSAVPYRYVFALSFVGMGFLVFQVFSDIGAYKTKAQLRRARTITLNNDYLQRVRKDRERYGRAAATDAS